MVEAEKKGLSKRCLARELSVEQSNLALVLIQLDDLGYLAQAASIPDLCSMICFAAATVKNR